MNADLCLNRRLHQTGMKSKEQKKQHKDGQNIFFLQSHSHNPSEEQDFSIVEKTHVPHDRESEPRLSGTHYIPPRGLSPGTI